ncbi:hypothetical protein SAMN05660464_0117 [Geodermatophilus dictyosporus]|uniref:YdhG-like domain-containing protein n=1 Tax=Geodermatophilus dictyosporus TaxID=1523247 RepID=A0A1I5U6Y9_9ACTN|nr:hypothetical protein [Geodermatophilus dictyosporus]SFP91035.1 hypothetical protein SAMN05660464_0117 [Geodermatophilus dictyosporus]
MDETWDALLAALPPATADLVRAPDALVRGADPDVVRVVWPHQRTVGYGLDVYDRHLDLGFNRGAALVADGLDGGLLAGTGRSFRKVAVRSADVLADVRLPALLRAARAE